MEAITIWMSQTELKLIEQRVEIQPARNSAWLSQLHWPWVRRKHNPAMTKHPPSQVSVAVKMRAAAVFVTPPFKGCRPVKVARLWHHVSKWCHLSVTGNCSDPCGEAYSHKKGRNYSVCKHTFVQKKSICCDSNKMTFSYNQQHKKL